MNILSRLRAATSQAHHALEADLDLISRLSSEAGRRAVVERFFSLHVAAEETLRPHLAAMTDLEFEARRRTPHLVRDLTALGGDARSAPPCPISAPDCSAEALGFFYVLEGSTLGGAVIRRTMDKSGGDMTGLSFLNPYAERTGERWRTFTALLEREGEDENRAGRMVAGAMRGFSVTREWLCAPAESLA